MTRMEVIKVVLLITLCIKKSHQDCSAYTSTGMCADGNPETEPCSPNADGDCLCRSGLPPTRAMPPGRCRNACLGRTCDTDPDNPCFDTMGTCDCQDNWNFDDSDDACLDDCVDKPCSGAGDCDIAIENSNRCNCNEPLTFDDDYNCVDVCTGYSCFTTPPATCAESNGVCTCNAGLRMDSNRDCINDCVGKQCYPDNDCTVNLDTLLCKCDDGLVFFGDNDRCVDVCSLRPCFAADLCSVVGGVCECKEGYRFDDDLNCVDDCDELPCIDENTCSMREEPIFLCECNEGLQFTNDGRCVDDCYDRDCRDDGQCFLEDAVCRCSDGYQLVGDDCIDVNECLVADSCDSYEDCFNSVGSFTCQCMEGFEPNSFTECEDTDECAQGTAQCTTNSDCVNNLGSFECICTEGFRKTSSNTCELIASPLTVPIAASVGGFMVVLIIIIIIVAIIANRRRVAVLHSERILVRHVHDAPRFRPFPIPGNRPIRRYNANPYASPQDRNIIIRI